MPLLIPLLVLALQDTTANVRVRVRTTTPQRAAAAAAAAEARRQAVAAAMPDAYADPAAAELVAAARSRRERAERLVTRYQVTVTQRIGLGLRAFSRDRMLFGQELAARIDWQRDGPTRVEVLGARQRIPVAVRGDQVPDDLDNHVEWLVIDPSADYLRIAGNDAEGFSHPLREGAEADYRYATGDTTTIGLPDGRTIRVLELRVRPRRAEFRLISGSLWFDADTHGLVRAVFAPARPFDFELDAEDDDDDVPAFVKPIRAEVRYVTIEYGLYEARWWMPRYWAIDAEAQASVMKTPLRFEREYRGYRVEGGAEPVAGARRPAGSVRLRERDAEPDTLPVDQDSLRAAIRACVDSIVAQETARAERARDGVRVNVRVGPRWGRVCREMVRGDQAWPVEVSVAGGDTAALLTSAALGPPILDMGDVISENELRNLAREIGAIPQRPWQLRPSVPSGVTDLLRYARYNRVEALSLGLSGRLDFGRLELDALGRIGVADAEPNGELGLTRPARFGRFRLAGYRRLAAANPDTRPFGALNSFSALLLGRDDGEYFRAAGVELTGEPAPTRTAWWRLRLYAERQRPAVVETRASLPHLFDHGQLFRPNIAAAAAEQAGAAVSLRGARALSGGAVLSADAALEGATGDFDFGRGALTLRASVPLGRPMLAIEAGAGTSTGTLAPQSLWFLGGPATLRGYGGGVLAGEAFWRVRGEIGTGLPLVRGALFSDAGWAGPRAAFGDGRPLVSVGVGASLLDGIVRLDLARGLRQPRGWRFDFYLDGLF